MHPILQKTFGGLSPQYYFRHLFFGFLIFAVFAFTMTRGPHPAPLVAWFVGLVFTFLYPYSRYVYESVVGFILGDSIVVMNFFFMLITKIFTMMMCWLFAIFVAPIGLAYLYYHHSNS